MGARTVVDHAATPAKPPKVFNRAGPISPTEQALVTQFVADQPREMTQGQVTALSKVLRRTRETVKKMVEEAREDLAGNISDYVATHKLAMQQALANGDAKSLEVATRAAQWGMENIAIEGVRVVDKAKSEDTGIRIQIGVKVGGMNEGATEPARVVTVAKVESEIDPPPPANFQPSGVGTPGGVLLDPRVPQGSNVENGGMVEGEIVGGESGD